MSSEIASRPKLGVEIANAVTHGVGVLLAIFALVFRLCDLWCKSYYALFGVDIVSQSHFYAGQGTVPEV